MRPDRHGDTVQQTGSFFSITYLRTSGTVSNKNHKP